jgi:hypothetical protein
VSPPVSTTRPARSRRRPRLDVAVLVVAVLLLGGVVPMPIPSGAFLDGFPYIAFGSGASPEPGSSAAGGASPSVSLAGPSETPAVSPCELLPGEGPPPSTANTVTVHSIPSLLDVLADNSVDLIVVANGTYHVSESSQLASDSLWIGGRYETRTRPLTVQAETNGGVIFDGRGGGDGYGGLSFEDGAHDQTWIGFTFANMAADRSGIIGIGGYTVRRAPHHITLQNIRILRSCTGSATSHSAPALDHAIYVANALDPGPHDLVFDNVAVDGRGGLASALHFFHSSAGAPNASHVTIRDLRVTGTQQAVILWDSTLRDIVFEGGTITGAMNYAIRYETTGSLGIVIRDMTSVGSGFDGFYSSLGSAPAGISFFGTSLR